MVLPALKESLMCRVGSVQQREAVQTCTVAVHAMHVRGGKQGIVLL
jgi:hypothetical protein